MEVNLSQAHKSMILWNVSYFIQVLDLSFETEGGPLVHFDMGRTRTIARDEDRGSIMMCCLCLT